MAASGAGVVLSTHDPNHAFAIATRVALMRGGEIAAIGNPYEALTAGHLSAIYGVAVEVEPLSSGLPVCTPAGFAARIADRNRTGM